MHFILNRILPIPENNITVLAAPTLYKKVQVQSCDGSLHPNFYSLVDPTPPLPTPPPPPPPPHPPIPPHTNNPRRGPSCDEADDERPNL